MCAAVLAGKIALFTENYILTKLKMKFHKTTKDLAEQVFDLWGDFVRGDYTPPPIPNKKKLRYLFEIAYLATMETEESRLINCMICCSEKNSKVKRCNKDEILQSWSFDINREYNIQEIRRLSVATDQDNTAIWVEYDNSGDKIPEIHGLLYLGASWSTARNAFSYFYEPLPKTLTIRCISPGYINVYQGEYIIASFKSGICEVGNYSYSPLDLLGAYPIFQEGHDKIREEIITPKHEYIKDWHEFEWIAYVNSILAIVNKIKIEKHGGALILVGFNTDLIEKELVKIKYRLSQFNNHLKDSFVKFINLRHKHTERLIFLQKNGKNVKRDKELNLTYFELTDAEKKLAEDFIFIGNLSSTDGALLLRNDLKLEGFGTEIVLDKSKRSIVYKVDQPMSNKYEELDSEQFGMRHRSAIRLCSNFRNVVVFIVSQDGGTSLVWNKEGKVYFKQDIKTTNMNMILS